MRYSYGWSRCKSSFLLGLLAGCVWILPVQAQDESPTQTTPEQRFFEWTQIQFEKEVYQQRRARLVKNLKEAGGGVYLSPSAHGVSHGHTFRQLDDFLYFTGLELPHSILALDATTGTTILFTPDRDARFESASRPNDFPGRRLGDDPDIISESGIPDIRPYGEVEAQVKAWIEEGSTLWVNPGHRSELAPLQTDFVVDWSPVQVLQLHLQNQFPEAQVRSAYGAVARVRMIKGPEEIASMRQVCDLTIQAIREAAGFIRDGVDERTLEAELEAVYKRGGAQRLSFSSIIKSGPNSLWPWRILAAHNDRRNRRMHDGELVIFDVGTELNHYISDVGRTFPVSGTFTPEQRKTLEMEVAVADAIIAAIRPGVTLPELTEIAIAAIPPEERPYMQTGSFFGHHIGLSAGDPSLLDVPLAPGMIFTVEPWYYNHDRNIAVFTEDVILVTEDGAEVLTEGLPRSPEDLERLVGTQH